jgi:hypothetical protein
MKHINNRFLVYDQVKVLPKPVDWDAVERSLREEQNIAFVDAWDGNGHLGVTGGNVLKIQGPGQGIEILKFWLNGMTIRTNFSVPKFLVFNDTYHRGWKCRLDGQAGKIYRANVAFQGTYLPAGQHVVTFRFVDNLWIIYGVWFLFLGMFTALMWFLGKGSEKK